LGVKAKSKEELDQRDIYPALPADTFVMEIESVEVKNQANPFEKTPEEPEGHKRDVAWVRFKPLEFANGDELVDWEDNDVPPEKLVTGFFDLTRLGFSKAHGPSKARRFLAAITRQDIEDELEVGEWEEYKGTKVVVTTTLATKDGNKVNYIEDVRAYRKRGKKATEDTETEAEPVKKTRTPKAAPEESLSDVDLTAKAKEVFGEDGF
jgi:hypothetical protein